MAISFLNVVSLILGWTYTICWSLSFYPQPLLNWRRRSTSGTTIDFPAINTLGFAALAVYNAAFLYSPRIRDEYARRHHGLTPTVQVNDLAFAVHATVLSFVVLSQFWPQLWGFDVAALRSRGSRVSRSVLGILVGCVGAEIVVLLIVAGDKDQNPVSGWAWIDSIYALSYIKLLITLVKYMPQVLTNYRNRSTHGWAIGQILLDFVGGITSIAQLLIDSYEQRDWSGVTGNPIKLALGNISMFFDVIFMIQHYCLYTEKEGGEDVESNSQEEPLLGDRA